LGLRASDGECGNSAISILGALNPFLIRLIWTRVIQNAKFKQHLGCNNGVRVVATFTPMSQAIPCLHFAFCILN
jgi:hypothetical protein